MWQHILWVGLAMGGISLLTQAGAIRLGLDHWRTMVFTVLALSQMANVLAIRSERELLFRQGLLSNLPLLGAVLLTIALQLMTIYVPALNPIFETAPLTWAELTVCLALSSLTFVIIETEKWLARRGLIYREHSIEIAAGAVLDLPAGRRTAGIRRNLAIDAGIEEGSQSTRKLSCPEIKTFRKTARPSRLNGLWFPKHMTESALVG